MAKDYKPRYNEGTEYLNKCANEAGDRLRNMSSEEREEHERTLNAELSRVNLDSQKTIEGQARVLSMYEHIKYKG